MRYFSTNDIAVFVGVSFDFDVADGMSEPLKFIDLPAVAAAGSFFEASS